MWSALTITNMKRFARLGIAAAAVSLGLSFPGTSPASTMDRSQESTECVSCVKGHMKIYEALKLAVEEIERQKMMYREQYKMTAARVEDEWVFWFVFLPQTPGLDVTVCVSD